MGDQTVPDQSESRPDTDSAKPGEPLDEFEETPDEAIHLPADDPELGVDGTGAGELP